MLWPFALLAAADRLNNLHIDLDGNTPEMKFLAATGSVTRLSNFHTFGCPVYILDARLQSAGGPGSPKWDPRARLGIYVGHSPCHAGSVALVMNPKTGLVSPQYHVVFDDDFSTVPHLRSGTVPENWAHLVQNLRERTVDGFYDVTKTWFEGEHDPTADSDVSSSPPQALDRSVEASRVLGHKAEAHPTPFGNSHQEGHSALGNVAGAQPTSSEGALADSSKIAQANASPKPPISDDDDISTTSFQGSQMPPIVDFTTAGLRRSSRTRSSPDRLTFRSFLTKICAFGLLLATAWTPETDLVHASQNLAFAAVNTFHAANRCFDGTINSLHHFALLAGKENNESYTFKQMLRQPDAADFVQAMIKEVNDHETRGHWEVIPRWQKPQGEKTVMAIWSFKRKRFPDGRLNKHKACICAHGGIQT